MYLLYYEKGNTLQKINTVILKNQVTLARETVEDILLPYSSNLKLLNNCERGGFGEWEQSSPLHTQTLVHLRNTGIQHMHSKNIARKASTKGLDSKNHLPGNSGDNTMLLVHT